MISWRVFRKASTAIVVSPIVLCGLLGQIARADTYESLRPGQSAWLPITLSPGEYQIQAWTIGDVDLELYNDAGTYKYRVRVVEADGYDTMYVSTDSTVSVNIRYSMMACLNPWGNCPVNIDVYRVN